MGVVVAIVLGFILAILILKDINQLVAEIRSILFAASSIEQSEIQADCTLPHAGRRRLVRVLYRLEVASHYHKQIEGHNNLPLDQ